MIVLLWLVAFLGVLLFVCLADKIAAALEWLWEVATRDPRG